MIKIEKCIHNFLTDSEQKLLFYFLSFILSGLFLAQVQFAYADKLQKNEVETLRQDVSADFIQTYDLNTVSYQQLITIKGIGPKKAQAILDYQKDVRFNKVEDLLEIKGIGEKTLRSLSPFFYVKVNNQNVFADTAFSRSDKAMVTRQKIDILDAGPEELMQIKGIGKKKALAITEYRSSHPINTFEDLLNIKGIGPKLLENIKSSAFIGQAGHYEAHDSMPKPDEALNTEKLNINTASLDELLLIKGIGQKTARAIIEYRDKNGIFKDLNQLLEVKGIGRKKLDNLKPFIYPGEANEQNK